MHIGAHRIGPCGFCGRSTDTLEVTVNDILHGWLCAACLAVIASLVPKSEPPAASRKAKSKNKAAGDGENRLATAAHHSSESPVSERQPEAPSDELPFATLHDPQ